ncbi:hypothetical protein [Brooklawnia cerclae]|uniref:Uncharacterized protein n=1 Tax=Brooklawnia cerclae TaxID=349934 RepID=A0ABX0SAK9_9ACTN|nr:hypothetical protein [Brooklawnia cerclae]NIH55438.1 hypothetical protein [Brooklawnia cerclae]
MIGALAGILTTGLALTGFSSQASADPASTSTYGQLVAVGSDTLQDFGNGLSTALGNVSGTSTLKLASYDATGSSTIQTRSGGVSFTRPNGSGDGVKALSASAQGTIWGGANLSGQVDIARSSSKYTTSTVSALAYVPVGVDAVTYATSSDSAIPSGILEGDVSQDGVGTWDSETGTVHPADLTLRNIFQGNGYLEGTISSVTYKFYSGAGNPADGSGYTKLNVYVPQSGSGTRSFWASTLGFSNSSLPAGVSDTFGLYNPDTEVTTTTDVQEHNGLVVTKPEAATETEQAEQGNQNWETAIVPFSIAQYVAQTNAAEGTLSGVTDRRHGAELNSVGNVAPTSGGALNSSFPIKRDVYFVATTARLTNPTTDADRLLAKFLINSGTADIPWIGSTALQSTITNYGFGTGTADTLGAIAGYNSYQS